MGYAARYPIDEDTLCAEYIRLKLLGEIPDYHEMTETIRRTSGKRFFVAGYQDFAPSTDFYLCLDLNRFDFVLKAEKIGTDMVSLKPVRNED
jgi:2-phosphosulfolactate phosphatase